MQETKRRIELQQTDKTDKTVSSLWWVSAILIEWTQSSHTNTSQKKKLVYTQRLSWY